MTYMKRLLLILVLTFNFQTWAKSDVINNFQIEGMSVGDSLLDHLSIKDIKSAYQNPSYYRDQIFVVLFITKKSKNYNRIQVTLKPNDKKHKIFAIEGIIDFDKKIDQCNEQKKIIIKDLEKTFSNYKRVDDDRAYAADPSNNSFSYSTWFFLNSGGFFSVSCTLMGSEIRKKNGWTDELSVAVTSEEMENFLRGNPY